MLAAAILSAFVFPMSWQLFVVYICVGGVIGFSRLLSTLDELPKVLAFIIMYVVALEGTDWMEAVAPHWYSPRWEPRTVVLGAMAAVMLTYVHRPIRE